MPFTPYHFGPNGLLGLIFNKWIDLPVFILVNVAVDIEVLIVNNFHLGRPIHRYAHTILGGAAIALVFAFLAFLLLRPLFEWAMSLFRLNYKPTLLKMSLAAILGAWAHALIDSIYNYDVILFWPSRFKPWFFPNAQPFIKKLCLMALAAAVILYLAILVCKNTKKTKNSQNS